MARIHWDLNYWHQNYKALAVATFFYIVGLLGYMSSAGANDAAPLLGLFYVVLTLNTYYSVRFFSPLTHPNDIAQRLMDVVLVLVYILLAFSFGAVAVFTFFALCLFIVATAKYALLIGAAPYATVRHKILIDLLGAAWCVICLCGALEGYTTESAWVLAGGFLIANLYLLGWRPMYALR